MLGYDRDVSESVHKGEVLYFLGGGVFPQVIKFLGAGD